MLAVLGILLVGAGVVFALTHVGRTDASAPAVADTNPLPDRPLVSMDGSQSLDASRAASAESSASAVEIEVPDVTGKPLTVAVALLQAAGLVTQSRPADQSTATAPPNTVVGQWPNAGARAQQGDRIVLTYQAEGGVTAADVAPVVVIDPGHQAEADLSLEPIGPGSTTMKQKVTGGATGVVTKVPEYSEALAISALLRARLVLAGVKVVMIRTTNDVHISNSQRAIIGNDAQADLVVRIHLDSAADPDVHGISTLYPSGNAWCTPIEEPSKRAAGLVEEAVTAATGAADRGLSPRADMTGFNWSTRPTILVECGFMSNAAEDRSCANAAYQGRLASGICQGVLAFLGR